MFLRLVQRDIVIIGPSCTAHLMDDNESKSIIEFPCNVFVAQMELSPWRGLTRISAMERSS